MLSYIEITLGYNWIRIIQIESTVIFQQRIKLLERARYVTLAIAPRVLTGC